MIDSATVATYAPGALVHARGREWVVQPGSAADFLVLRPLGGDDADVTALFPALEPVRPAAFAPPTIADMGDDLSLRMLRDALRIGFTSTAGPFRSLAGIPVQPRSYQLVPLLMAMRQETVRLLIADDVGIGKTIEAGLVAAELLALGEARGLAVLCSPALAEQWQRELRDKFAINAELVLPSTVTRLQRGLGLGESLFERYPYTVISTDFIKSRNRRDEFVRVAPDLVIVDEAHTAVTDGGITARSTSRTLRHELLRKLAADPTRHLLLVTATPHSGTDQGFRNLLELLDPTLAEVDLEQVADRTRLARHFVQRRRRDIRHYLAAYAELAQDTPFPTDRDTKEVPYTLTPAYRELFADVLDYARSRVQLAGESTAKQRVQWWSVLALLRALSSSPAAAAATLRTRAASAEATSVDEADALGRSAVLDLADDEALEALDATPGAITATDGTDETTGPGASERKTLLRFAKAAAALAGPRADAKLATITTTVKALLADGYDPIVFCRFIDTAEYVGAHLASALGRSAGVAVVTGSLPPVERTARIDALAAAHGRHVLVATDCLSEGVNLQDAFQAVVHYDLAWNPTRHEQREGRVDRFGQTRDVVRAVTIYGPDTQIDGIVLDVLLRKHEAIRKATGVSVPVPASSDSVVQALMEGLLLRGSDDEQLALDIAAEAGGALDAEWQSAAAKETRSRTKYAQEAIKPDEVAVEIEAIRAAAGTPDDVATFARAALKALGATVVVAAAVDDPTGVGVGGLGKRVEQSNAGAEQVGEHLRSGGSGQHLRGGGPGQASISESHPASGSTSDPASSSLSDHASGSAFGQVSGASSGQKSGLAPTRDRARPFTATTGTLPAALAQALTPGHAEPLPFHTDPPTPRREAVLARTDPDVRAIAGYVLEGALDPTALPSHVSRFLARRAGVFRSGAATARTVVLLLRERIHLTTPGRDAPRTHVVEHADVVAYTGSPEAPTWLDPAEVEALLDSPASALGADRLTQDSLQAALDGLPALAGDLERFAMATAEELRDSHRRVRAAAQDRLRGLKVEPVLPPDVLGVYVYLPTVKR